MKSEFSKCGSKSSVVLNEKSNDVILKPKVDRRLRPKNSRVQAFDFGNQRTQRLCAIFSTFKYISD